MKVPETIVDLGGKVMNRGHKMILTLSGGRVLNRAFGMTVVELHTTGRKSGQPRATMLTAPIRDGDRVVLVASKGGNDRHPDWYLNLSANPGVELTIDGDRRPYTARTATAEEKAEMWATITSTYKGYAGYQASTERDIPVVICDPR
ncbi:MAG TPA: nitroreductase family deazaflavin-dependent oxidoreductase [Acidimicrobiales bacterium]